MKILRNREQGILTLSPSTEVETAALRNIRANIQIGQLLTYKGRRGAGPNDPISERMELFFLLNGEDIVLSATADEDEHPIRFTRDAIFFGGGGLILVGLQESDGRLSLDFAVGQCKVCGKTIVSMSECEWKTCDACRNDCAHEYANGMVHGGDAGSAAVGEYCTKCGRGKPRSAGERKKSQLENHLEVQREFGVSMLYENMGGAGPKDLIQAKRLARRLIRSRQRQLRNTTGPSV